MKINPNKWWNVKTRLILPHSVNLSEKTCHFTPQKWWNICFFRSDFFCLIALWTLCCYGPKYSWKKSVFFYSLLLLFWNLICHSGETVVPSFLFSAKDAERITVPFFRLSFFVNWFFLYCNHIRFTMAGGWCRNSKNTGRIQKNGDAFSQ